MKKIMIINENTNNLLTLVNGIIPGEKLTQQVEK